MADRYQRYESPLVTRYASQEMSGLFGARKRIATWRELWIALAEGQRRCGLPISARQIAQLRQAADRIDFAAAGRYEKKLRHDVMAHLHAFGDLAPQARAILHLGATSAYIVDNTDLIIMGEALLLIGEWLANCIDALGRFAKRHRALPTLGFTHYQPAQLTTVGKRAALWCYDFVRDLEEIETRIERLRFRGLKGTTGTQASFMKLFEGNQAKIDSLEAFIARRFGFRAVEPVTGQTSPRKVDAQVAAALAGIAASAHKFANDTRLLANLREIEEPFEAGQVGSSAMAYKRNPMRCERATGLARLVISLANSPLQTAAEQWFERTLDDSSNRRVVIPEMFLATEGLLRTMANVARGLVVYPKVIAARVAAELPFIATENILMTAVAVGGDRQELHERLRQHSQAAAARIKRDGLPNDLLERIAADPAFAGVDLKRAVSPRDYIGRAPQQVDAFNRDYVTPTRRKYRGVLGRKSELNV